MQVVEVRVLFWAPFKSEKACTLKGLQVFSFLNPPLHPPFGGRECVSGQDCLRIFATGCTKTPVFESRAPGCTAHFSSDRNLPEVCDWWCSTFQAFRPRGAQRALAERCRVPALHPSGDPQLAVMRMMSNDPLTPGVDEWQKVRLAHRYQPVCLCPLPVSFGFFIPR